MGRLLAVLSLAGMILVTEPSRVFARLWTDVTGAYQADADFVEVVGESVRLLRTNGKTVDVPLKRLCVLDRVVAKHLQRQKAGIHFPAIPSIVPDRKSVIVVLVGVGTTADEALRDAFHLAVQLATGARVDSETRVISPGPAQQNVLTFSNGFVSHHEILDECRDGHAVRREVLTVVSRRDPSANTNATGNATSADVRDLYAAAYTKARRRKDGLAMLERTLSRLSQELLTVSLASQPSIVKQADDTVTLEYRITLGVDQARYEQARTEMVGILEDIAVRKGLLEGRCRPVPAAMKPRTDAMLHSRFLAVSGVENAGEGLTLECPGAEVFQRTRATGLPHGDLANYTAERPSTLLVVNLPLGKACAWKWFEIDAQLDVPQKPLAVAITYDGDGATAARRHRIAIGPGFPGVSANPQPSPPGNVRAVILSPFLMSYRGDGFCVADVVLTRTMVVRGETTFTIEELSRVRTLTVANPERSDLPSMLVMAGGAGNGK